jgi:hypothetical protein
MAFNAAEPGGRLCEEEEEGARRHGRRVHWDYVSTHTLRDLREVWDYCSTNVLIWEEGNLGIIQLKGEGIRR